MADADKNDQHVFYGNIFSPIDPRFNQYSAINPNQCNEIGRLDDKSGKRSVGDSYSFETWSSFTSSVSDDKENKEAVYYKKGLDRSSSIVDGLLSEIYDHWHDHRHDSFDSDTFTECSSTSEFAHWRRHSVQLEIAGRQLPYLHRGVLQDYGMKDLKNLRAEMSRHVSQISTRLVRQLKRRERRMSKMQTNCDIVTAIIQASSPKRRIDTRMKFSVEPPGGDSAFEQWKDGMKAVARLPLGIPAEFRKKVWLSLAEHHIANMQIDWEKTVKFAFNERSNPDDNKLGLQIVKDLHRTGCSGFSGEDNEEERALLKRILLAYARWNKAVGYCQGFNMIAALLLDVMDRNESDALKVMIFLIDHVLPQGYFANNLRALSVDMAVFRDLLKVFPKLSRHLDYLQHAQDQTSGGCYEPPLTNVFTMQWFLTLFATCLPKSTVLRVWDSILLDGSEILLRTALVIWGKLSSRILTVSSADEFYTLMGDITQEMLEGNILDADTIIKSIYSIAPFPLPQLTELREKYTYNIRPFTPHSKKASWPEGAALPSDEDDLEEEDLENITCFTGFIPTNVTSKLHKGLDGDQRTGSLPDISSLGPGAYGLGPADGSGVSNIPAYMERMTTDIGALKKQYTKLRQRQNQAHIILTSASAKQQVAKAKPMLPHIETPIAMNHLFLNKQDFKGRNRFVAEGPRIANVYPVLEPKELSKQHRNIKTKSKQMRLEKEFKSLPMAEMKQNPVVTSSTSVNAEVEIHNERTDECKETKTGKVSENVINASGLDNKDTDAAKEVIKTVQGNESNVTGDLRDIDNKLKNIDEGEQALDGEMSGNVPKFGRSPVKHGDSGLGNSLCSSVLSSSSTENSPQHSVFWKSTAANQADDSVMDTTADATNSKESVEGSLADTDLESFDNRKAINQKLLKHFSRDTEIDVDFQTILNDIDDVLDDLEVNENVEGDCDVIKESGDTGAGVEGLNDDGNTGASGDHRNVEETAMADKIKDEILHEDNAENFFNIKNVADTDDSATQQVLYTDKGNSCCMMPDKHAKDFAGDAKEVVCADKNRTDLVNETDTSKGSNTGKTRLSSSDTVTAKSLHLSDSSNSTIVSADDCETVSEVFTTNASASQASFQQYYINKRNLSSEPQRGMESQCSKTQLPKKMFNPFPVKHINQNRARTGIKLGLYKPSTLQEFEKNLNKSQPVWGK